VASTFLANSVNLAKLAAGRLVTSQAKRQPNRLLTLSRSRTAGTSVTPQQGHWDHVPEPLLVRDFARLRSQLASSPPPPIRARLLAEGVRVLAVAGVDSLSYSRSRQTLTAQLRDVHEDSFPLRMEHNPAAPFALNCLAEALARGPSFVSGELEFSGELHLRPLAVVTSQGVQVPDLVEESSAAIPESPGWERPDDLKEALGSCGELLDEACQWGLSHLSSDWGQRAQAMGQHCGQLGFKELGSLLQSLGRQPSLAGWLECALRLELTELRLALGGGTARAAEALGL
jgi:hypothetical protein